MNLGNVFILGDSYSTFEDCIPNGYAVYYNKANNYGGVSKAEDTWWDLLIKETGSKLVMNNSYSGSTICNTGYNGDYCVKTSFVTRINQHLNGKYNQGEQPDTVLVFGGTNDFWADSPLGVPKYSEWTDKDLRMVFPSFSYTLSYIKEHNPECRVIAIINSDLGEKITIGMHDICSEMRVDCIQLSGIEKENRHPTLNGMKEIKDQILSYLNNTKTCRNESNG